ncbi:NYN domain-containing protein, partial [Suillus ampliporus]
MSNHRKVAVFWDYENCSPPLNSQGHAIVNGIRRIAHVFGYVTSFKAYLDMSTQSPKSVGFRSDLQSSGVSLIDCPHNGRKEVVDKMILVDMITFAVDNPSPATIILIAGDRDYAYAVSTLRLRQYSVVLIVPPAPNIPQSLESQASVVVDWNYAVLGKRTEADTSPAASTGTPKKAASTIPETPARPSFGSVMSRARSTTQSTTQTVPDIDQDSTSPLKGDNKLPDESLADDFVSTANEIQDATRDPFTSTIARMERNPNDPGLPPPISSRDVPRSPFPAVPFNLKSPPLHARTIPGSTPISYGSTPQKAPSVTPMSQMSSLTPSPSTPSSLTLSDSDSNVTASDVENGSQQAMFVISDNNDPSSGCQAPSIESVEDKIRRTTPPQFLPLINLLLLARSKGNIKPSRSIIAVDLVQFDKNVYKRAGVTRFAQYTALAEQASLLELENCSPPLNSQGHAIVNGIRRIAHVFGYVTSFKAYLDVSSQSPKSVGFRSDLQSSGVSMIDCPHNGKKDVVDKMILVDMFAFATENPSPATVILIAGDRDYAYAVSTLRLRQYDVVLIVPPAPNIPQSLESQASVVVDW